jgi:hypothetical protein
MALDVPQPIHYYRVPLMNDPHGKARRRVANSPGTPLDVLAEMACAIQRAAAEAKYQREMALSRLRNACARVPAIHPLHFAN